MRVWRIIFHIGLAVLAPAFCALAADGWMIPTTVTDLTAQPAQDYRAVMTLAGLNLRINTADFTGESTHLIMTTQSNSIWHVNTTTRTYQRINERSLAQVGEHVEAMQGYFRKQMGKWKDSPVVEVAIQVKSTGETRTLQGVKCQKYEIWAGSEKQRQVWAAPWSQVGLEKASFQSVRQLVVLYEKVKQLPGVMLTLADGGRVSLEGVPGIDGYPVLIEHLAQGRVVCRIQLGKPEKTTVQDSAFTVPSGYKVQWF